MANASGLLEYWKFAADYIQSLLANPPDNYVGDLTDPEWALAIFS